MLYAALYYQLCDIQTGYIYMFVNERHYVIVIHHVCDGLMRHRKLESSHLDKCQQVKIGVFTMYGKY